VDQEILPCTTEKENLEVDWVAATNHLSHRTLSLLSFLSLSLIAFPPLFILSAPLENKLKRKI
jgi:hypothetical protein